MRVSLLVPVHEFSLPGLPIRAVRPIVLPGHHAARADVSYRCKPRSLVRTGRATRHHIVRNVMNAELMPSAPAPEASPSRPSAVRVPDRRLSGWWDPPSGRLDIGGRTRTQDLAARSLDSTARSVGHAREFAADAARGWGLAALEEDLRLIVSELVGNACRHAVPAGADPARSPLVLQLRLLRSRTPWCAWSPTARFRPHPRRRPPVRRVRPRPRPHRGVRYGMGLEPGPRRRQGRLGDLRRPGTGLIPAPDFRASHKGGTSSTGGPARP